MSSDTSTSKPSSPCDTSAAAQSALPCPFCGGEARTRYVRDGRQVLCNKCGAAGPAEFHGRLDQPPADARAIASWNMRAASIEAPTPEAHGNASSKPEAVKPMSEFQRGVEEAIKICQDVQEMDWGNGDTAFDGARECESRIRSLASAPPPVGEKDCERCHGKGTILRWVEESGLRVIDDCICVRSPAPAGWKLVPVEPTPEMIRAMDAPDWEHESFAVEAYKNMLAAAPRPALKGNPE